MHSPECYYPAMQTTSPGPLARAWTALAEALWPARCLGCGRRGPPFCPECWSALPRLRPPQCPRCARPERGGTPCRACQRADPALSAVRAPCSYTGAVRQAVRRLKYHQERHLAEPLAMLLIEALRARPLAVDAIVPVPLDRERAHARGYNQAALLAAPAAAALTLPVAADALQRTRATRSQVGLSARARRANVRGAFACTDASAVAGRRVLLVDDVMTTGATLEACASALMAAGATSVWGLVVARDLPEGGTR